MDDKRLGELITVQDGVVSRAQLVGCGAAPHDIKRMVRQRLLTRMLPGVFVDHTGEPSWQQRAVAGVLHAGYVDGHLHMVGAALGGHSAIRAALDRSWRHAADGAPIEVCIGDRRTVSRVAGYRFTRTASLEARTDWLRTPPRLRVADAALDVALRCREPVDSVGLLADVFQTRLATASDVEDAMSRRARVPGRHQLTALLADLGSGSCSVLEYEFLVRVVRAHGLPEPDRQVERRTDTGRELRDAEWRWLVVELDGRQFHDHASQRAADLERDLDDAVAGRRVVRLGWAQATTHACRTARKLAVLLQAGGWDGTPSRCPLCVDA